MVPYKDLLLAVPELAYDMLANDLRFKPATCTRCDEKDYHILKRHCTCDDKDRHNGYCERFAEGRCTNCGYQGCLDLSYPKKIPCDGGGNKAGFDDKEDTLYVSCDDSTAR